MLKSAENFMAGFFGLEWTQNATIEVIIEGQGFNNSLAGYMNCPNGQKVRGGTDAANICIHNYLQNGKSSQPKLTVPYPHLLTHSPSNRPPLVLSRRLRMDD